MALDRVRPEFSTAIVDDLTWLGLTWSGPVRAQSDHLSVYQQALDDLAARGLLYPCSCNRRDIRDALPADAALGPDGPVYPGTCRGRPMAEAAPEDALRIDMARACATLTGPLHWHDALAGPQTVTTDHLIHNVGDVVLRRRLTGMPAYHLSVTVDDALQGITHVIRGQDLFDATAIHILLQHLLGLPRPAYHHHGLIVDETGKRLAKSHNSQAIATLRAAGATPCDIYAHIADQMPEVTGPP